MTPYARDPAILAAARSYLRAVGHNPDVDSPSHRDICAAALTAAGIWSPEACQDVADVLAEGASHV